MARVDLVLPGSKKLNDAEKSLISPRRISASGTLSRSTSRMNDAEDEQRESEALEVFCVRGKASEAKLICFSMKFENLIQPLDIVSIKSEQHVLRSVFSLCPTWHRQVPGW